MHHFWAAASMCLVFSNPCFLEFRYSVYNNESDEGGSDSDQSGSDVSYLVSNTYYGRCAKKSNIRITDNFTKMT